MAASRNCPYAKQKTFTRFLASFMWLLLLALLVAPSLALAQSREEKAELAEAGRLNKEAIALYNAGRFSQAEPLYRRALAIREKVLV